MKLASFSTAVVFKNGTRARHGKIDGVSIRNVAIPRRGVIGHAFDGVLAGLNANVLNIGDCNQRPGIAFVILN